MKTRGFWTLDEVSDTQLVGGLKELVARSSWTEARLVAYLAELDARKLHLLAGKSLFAYCQQQLGLSGNEAHYRIQAARMARKFPVIFELLEQRRIHLSALALIRHYITPENHVELLREVSGKTKEQILRLLATRAPRPEVANRIRTLAVPPGAVAAGPSGALEPRSAVSYCLQLNIGESFKQKLELVCDLMSHSNPSRDWTIVVERGLDALLDKLQKQRFALTSGKKAGKLAPGVVHDGKAESAPRTARTGDADPVTPPERRTRPIGSACSRQRGRIPSEVLRRLVERDGVGCAYTSAGGERCGERAFLQVHHRQPWARGGAETLDNLQLVCADHNRLLAERDFGIEQVQAAIERKRVA